MGCLLNKFLSYGSEGWKSRIIALADLYLMRPTSWFRDSPLLIVFSCDRRGMKTLWGLFYKGTNPDHEVSVLMTSSLSTNPSFKYQHFGILILKEHKYLPIASSYGHFFVLYSCILGPYHHHHHQVNMLCISWHTTPDALGTVVGIRPSSCSWRGNGMCREDSKGISIYWVLSMCHPLMLSIYHEERLKNISILTAGIAKKVILGREELFRKLC